MVEEEENQGGEEMSHDIDIDILIYYDNASRGWEASHTLIVALHPGWENIVMRTIGYCALVKKKK